MKNFAKKTLEYISGHRVRLEPSSELGEVMSLIRDLKPISIDLPLVRLGSLGDGGYLAPNDLEGISVSVSPGVSTEIGFDLAMAERGLQIYMADASVDGPPIQHPHFHFYKKFLDVFDNDHNMRLDALCNTIAIEHAGDRILQMDIEGAEYRVLLDTSDEVLRSFRIMMIEFHNLDRMFAAFPLKMIRATFQKLLRFHHIVHIHPNNVCGPLVRGDIAVPPVMEFTFYRKDRAVLDGSRKLQFPHPLDRDNVPHARGYALPDCWR